MSSTAPPVPELSMTRTFDVPRERVWQAWTDEADLASWLRPFGVSTDSVSFDVCVGGQYSYTMTNDETGETYPTGGQFLVVRAPDQLVLTWGEPGTAADAAPVLTLTFAEHAESAESTDLTLHLRGYEGQPGDGFVYDGWAEALTNLGKHLAGETPA